MVLAFFALVLLCCSCYVRGIPLADNSPNLACSTLPDGSPAQEENAVMSILCEAGKSFLQDAPIRRLLTISTRSKIRHCTYRSCHNSSDPPKLRDRARHGQSATTTSNYQGHDHHVYPPNDDHLPTAINRNVCGNHRRHLQSRLSAGARCLHALARIYQAVGYNQRPLPL